MKKGSRETVIGQSNYGGFEKIWHMVKYIRDGQYPIICTVECAIKHTEMMHRFNDLPVNNFSKETKRLKDDLTYIHRLDEILIAAYDNFVLPIID